LKAKTNNVAAAILAGGSNSRMGGLNKAFIRINGVPVIKIALGLLKKSFKEIIIVTNSPHNFKSYQKEAIITEDLIKDAGPLGGIHSALIKTSKRGVFFVACDMPFLHNALINRLIKHFNRLGCEAVVPRINSLIEPMHAVYRSSLGDRLGSFLRMSSDYSIKSFLRGKDVEYLDLEDNPLNRRIFKNLNTPDDLKKAIGAGWK